MNRERLELAVGILAGKIDANYLERTRWEELVRLKVDMSPESDMRAWLADVIINAFDELDARLTLMEKIHGNSGLSC